MWSAFRCLILGLSLIAGASALLLWSDTGSRVAGGKKASDTVRRVALLQHASQAVIEDSVQGMIDGLAEGGYVQGKNLHLQRFNAEGDVSVSNTIAAEMVSGKADLLMTCSTVSLQAVGNANRHAKKPLVFGSVSDPSITGLGISKEDPLDHPEWIAGCGTMQPVAEALQAAKEMNPGLRKIGVVWNASEVNSEGQIIIARRVCRELGMELMEAAIDSSSGVGEAARALTARGAEALFLPGDMMVLVAADAVIAAGQKANIPVFTVTPPNAAKGALFDYGADYYQVGLQAGRIAAEVLSGRNPAEMEITNYLPSSILLNEKALAAVKDKGWSFPDSIRRRASVIYDETGKETPGPAAKPEKTVQKRTAREPIRLGIVVYVESLPAEDVLEGLHEGMKKWPLKEGRDYVIQIRNAQGDMAALSGMIDAAIADKADIIIPLCTPALQATINKVNDRPVVFSLVASPMAAGAGKSFEDHLPNVTGISVLAPVDSMFDLLDKYYPEVRSIGTLYCPAEANSVDLRDLWLDRAKARGFKTETVAVNSPTELADAAMSLAGKPIDAIVQISDNISSVGFGAIFRAARQARKPLLSLNSSSIPLGAPVALGHDYVGAGRATAEVLLRVMQGESPAGIPIILPPNVVTRVSEENAKAVGMKLPEELVKASAVQPEK